MDEVCVLNRIEPRSIAGDIFMRHGSKIAAALLPCLLAACAQTSTHVASTTPATSALAGASSITESRDASIAYIGTANFVVGRVGRDCLSLVGRSDPPQSLVAAWQRRNAKYVSALDKYLQVRLAHAEAAGGKEKRDAVMRELTGAVQRSASSGVKRWLDRPDKPAACKWALGVIESGAYDISSTSPMFAELESLVAWAEQR